MLAPSDIYEQQGNIKKSAGNKSEYIETKERIKIQRIRKKIQLFQSLNELDKTHLSSEA
jgi:hypothetical protein